MKDKFRKRRITKEDMYPGALRTLDVYSWILEVGFSILKGHLVALISHFWIGSFKY